MPRFEVFRRYSLLLLLSGACLFSVGCASNSGNTEAGQDIETASDETETRRRARIRFELAIGYFQQDRTTIALDEIKQAILIDPMWGDSYNLRGLIYMKLGEAALAEDSFKRAMTLAPGDGSVLHNAAWLNCTLRRYAQAYPLFEQALRAKNYTDSSKTYLSMAMCQQADGRHADAERSFGKSYELDASNPVAGYNLALIHFQRHDFVKAQFYLARLNASEYVNAQTLWLGVKTERKLGNREAYRSLADRLQRKHAGSVEARKYERGQFDD
ncbi:MAG: type pilus biosis/stability protein PilW [Pseudomonadota bacterium]|jgi:type IV pilus assembly protein PilF